MKIFIIVAVVIVAGILQLILQHRQVGDLQVDISPDVSAAEPDEIFHITIRIDNPSWIIYPFVRFAIILPEEMKVHTQMRRQSHPPASIAAIGSALLWPKRSFTKTIEVSAPHRGNWRFGNVYLEVGDFLGLKEYKKEFSYFCSVAVYPRPLKDMDVDETLGSVMGDYSVRRYIYEDPVLISGFREYSGREPMKSISWLQSARTGQLMVKKYDFTSQMSVSVVLDTEKADELLESCFSLSRSVLQYLEDKNIEYDFFLNSDIGGANSNQHYFARGMGNSQFYGIMKQLAYAVESCAFSSDELVRKVMESCENVPGIIFISAARSGEKERLIEALAENPTATVSAIYAEDF